MSLVSGSTAGHVVAQALLGNVPDLKNLESAEQEVAALPRAEASQEMISDVMTDSHGKTEEYVSTPITGGKRLYEFLAKHHVHTKKELGPDDLKTFEHDVIQANCGVAREVASKVRATGETVVEPAQIVLPGWNQTKYNANWIEFIQKLPFDQVRECDGWQLSYGCLLEVRAALDKGIPVVDADGKQMNREAILSQVQAAVAKAKESGFQLDHLSHVLTDPIETLPLEDPQNTFHHHGR